MEARRRTHLFGFHCCRVLTSIYGFCSSCRTTSGVRLFVALRPFCAGQPHRPGFRRECKRGNSFGRRYSAKYEAGHVASQSTSSRSGAPQQGHRSAPSKSAHCRTSDVGRTVVTVGLVISHLSSPLQVVLHLNLARLANQSILHHPQ